MKRLNNILQPSVGLSVQNTSDFELIQELVCNRAGKNRVIGHRCYLTADSVRLNGSLNNVITGKYFTAERITAVTGILQI